MAAKNFGINLVIILHGHKTKSKIIIWKSYQHFQSWNFQTTEHTMSLLKFVDKMYKLGKYLSCVTLKFHEWHWKTIGHLSYSTSNSVHHFIATVGFILELQSGNAHVGSKLTIFFGPCDLEIWRMIFKNKMGISPKPHQTVRIILSPCGNSNWSCRPETAILGFDLCDLDFDLWLDLLYAHDFCQCESLLNIWSKRPIGDEFLLLMSFKWLRNRGNLSTTW